MANNFKGRNWKEVEIQEDKGHFGGSDKCFVEYLVQVEVLYQSAILFFARCSFPYLQRFMSPLESKIGCMVTQSPFQDALATVSIEDISLEHFLTNASEYFLDPCTQLPFLLAPIHLLITQGTHQRDENTYIRIRNSSRQPPPPPNTNSDNSNGQHVNWNCDLNP